MKYIAAFFGICIVALMLLATGLFWRDSERQYASVTNLGLRLQVLQQVASSGAKLGREDWPAWEVAWNPMVTVLQIEAQHAVAERRSIHLSEPMYEQIAQFAVADIGSEAALRDAVAKLDFSEAVAMARMPIVFSEPEQQYSILAVDRFRNETATILSREAAYSDWLAPILREQRLHDTSVACKTLKEVSAFQAYSDRLRSRCANAASSTKDKWKACSGENAAVTRQIRELQVTAEANLKKFKMRWPVKDGEDICSDL